MSERPESATSTEMPSQPWLQHCFLLLAGAVALAGISAALSMPMHHDTAWLAYVAGRVIDGASLYVDVIETNPPLIVWLFVPIVAFARMLGAWEGDVYTLTVAAASIVSSLVSMRLLSILWPQRGFGRAALGLVMLYLLLGSALLAFGQREHLMLITTLPYIMLAALRTTGARIRSGRAVALGIAAGIGFALKPHFLAVWIAIEAGVLASAGLRAWRRPEAGAVASVLVAYLVAAAILTPAYFTLIGWAAGVYSAYHTMGPLAVARSTETWLVVGALTVAFALPGTPAGRPVRRLIGLALGGLWVAAVLQGKGWDYHWFPVRAAAGLLLSAALIDVSAHFRFSDRLRIALWPTVLRALGLAGLAAMLLLATSAKRKMGHQLWDAMSARAYQLPVMIDAVEEHAGAGPIFIFSTNMQAGFPLVNYTNVAWGSRFNSLWPLPGLYPYRAPSAEPFPYHSREAMSRGEAILFESVVEDLERNTPTLIIVDKAPPGWQLYGFDYFDYFGRDPRFIAEIAQYEVVQEHERYLFLRRRAPGPM